jgi:hypothetical protein
VSRMTRYELKRGERDESGRVKARKHMTGVSERPCKDDKRRDDTSLRQWRQFMETGY